VRFFQRASKGKKGGKMIFEIIPKIREGKRLSRLDALVKQL